MKGAWRSTPPRSTLTLDELERIVPLALENGLAGLLWWTIRDRRDLTDATAGATLKEAWLRHVLQQATHERRLPAVLATAQAAGIDTARECLLVKGVTIADRYPERGLRPHGDIDLAVAPHQRIALEQTLAARPFDADWVAVDTKHRFLRSDGTPFTGLLARSAPRTFGSHTVRVLGEEDTLRVIPVHYIDAGGFRLLALCDTAMLFENAGEVDWDLVLAGDPTRRAWLGLAAGLTERLLGADLSRTPLAGAGDRVPAWAVRHVLWRFSLPVTAQRPWGAMRKADGVRERLSVVREHRLSDPLITLVRLRRPIRSRSPWGWQLADVPGRLVRSRGA